MENKTASMQKENYQLVEDALKKLGSKRKFRVHSCQTCLSNFKSDYYETKQVYTDLSHYLAKGDKDRYELHRKQDLRLLYTLSILEELIGAENLTGGAE